MLYQLHVLSEERFGSILLPATRTPVTTAVQDEHRRCRSLRGENGRSWLDDSRDQLERIAVTLWLMSEQNGRRLCSAVGGTRDVTRIHILLLYEEISPSVQGKTPPFYVVQHLGHLLKQSLWVSAWASVKLPVMTWSALPQTSAPHTFLSTSSAPQFRAERIPCITNKTGDFTALWHSLWHRTIFYRVAKSISGT